MEEVQRGVYLIGTATMEGEMYDRLFSLEERTIVVTGASSGLGRGLSSAYAKAGANIVAASRNLPKLEELCHEIESGGGNALAVKTDVTKKTDVEKLLKLAVERFASVDVLLNNAGISIPGLLAEEVSEAQMQKIMDTNFKGIFLCGTAIGRYMLSIRKGKIINMSSVLGQRTWAKSSIYCASKAAINQITKAWAIEWGPKNVIVNALAPTFIITEMNRHLLAQEEYKSRVMGHLPIGKFGTIEDLIGPAIFLASTASDFMMGHILNVDGGWTCV